MSKLLSNRNVSVETDNDRVIFTVDRTAFPMPYAVAFRLAAGVKLACKQAMRITKESLANAEAYTKSDFEVAVNEVSLVRRNLPVPRFEWSCEYQGEMVYVWFGDVEIGFHFSDGLKIAQWIRLGGTQAKRWAGDTSKAIHAAGILTNAEDNYKYGYQ